MTARCLADRRTQSDSRQIFAWYQICSALRRNILIIDLRRPCTARITMFAHTHCLHSVPACRGLDTSRLARQQCSGAQTVCHASRAPDVALLERPDMRRKQDPARTSSDRDRPSKWLEAKQGDISQHNQVLPHALIRA